MAQEMAQEKNLQPWEYVYKLLMPAEVGLGKSTEYIYLTLTVPLTKEFDEKIRRGDIKDLELPVYPVAFGTKPAVSEGGRIAFKGERIATKKDLLTRSGLYDNDYDFEAPIKDFEFNDTIPGYLPLAVLELHFKGGVIANPDEYGLKPIDGYKWGLDNYGSYKVTSGSLFNIAKAEIEYPHTVIITLGKNPQEFNTLNGYGVAQFYIDLENAPEEVRAKAKEECISAGGIYRYDAGKEIAYCTLPLNKEANIKASEFIHQLYEMVKSKITSEDFLKHDMTVKLAGSERIPVKPIIGKTFQEMVKVAEKRDLILGGEEKETKQESQGQLFNPFTIVDETLAEEQKQQNETEKEEENNTIKLS